MVCCLPKMLSAFCILLRFLLIRQRPFGSHAFVLRTPSFFVSLCTINCQRMGICGVEDLSLFQFALFLGRRLKVLITCFLSSPVRLTVGTGVVLSCSDLSMLFLHLFFFLVLCWWLTFFMVRYSPPSFDSFSSFVIILFYGVDDIGCKSRGGDNLFGLSTRFLDVCLPWFSKKKKKKYVMAWCLILFYLLLLYLRSWVMHKLRLRLIHMRWLWQISGFSSIGSRLHMVVLFNKGIHRHPVIPNTIVASVHIWSNGKYHI